MPNHTNFIRKSLHALSIRNGFKDFDGINYYCLISDEVIGLVSPSTEAYKCGGKALLTPKIGIIHFQMNCLRHDFLENNNLWEWTLSNNQVEYLALPMYTEQLTFKNEETKAEVEERLNQWSQFINESVFPRLSSEYSDLQSIASFIADCERKEPERYFASQYLLRGEQAIPQLKLDLEDMGNRFHHWSTIEYRLAQLEPNSLKVEHNKTAKTRVFAAADARRTLVLQDPPSRRPTS